MAWEGWTEARRFLRGKIQGQRTKSRTSGKPLEASLRRALLPAALRGSG